jgi:hypothetical protein
MKQKIIVHFLTFKELKIENIQVKLESIYKDGYMALNDCGK